MSKLARSDEPKVNKVQMEFKAQMTKFSKEPRPQGGVLKCDFNKKSFGTESFGIWILTFELILSLKICEDR
jgi:hypothetical protein